MLSALMIRNFAVIESVALHFHPGFHVLTGETGAGKSIIIDALSLIAGGRSSAEFVRHGCDKAEIEALFEIEANHPVWNTLDKLGITAIRDEDIIIRRDISSQGKSTSRINGQLVNLSMLREVGEWLVNIHGQHEHQSLLKVDRHLDLLDMFGIVNIQSIKSSFQDAYQSYTTILKELNQLENLAKQAVQMEDMYRFQVDEIKKAGLESDEDESLQKEKRKLANAEKLMSHVSESYEALYHQGLQLLGNSISKMEQIIAYDRSVLEPIMEQMQASFYQVEDAVHQLRDYRENIEFDSNKLDQIEERLALISSFRRKYGDNVNEILQYLARIEQEIDMLESKDEEVKKLTQASLVEQKKLVELAQQLTNQRLHAAEQLSAAIENELEDLQMEKTKFAVQLEKVEDNKGLESDGIKYKYNRKGWDFAEFLISANPGEPLRSLHKIASGGELSRIMLALKTIFAQIDQIPVLVFDEVDTGVSGRAAQAIAEKISLVSKNCQVFAITHLPQVACMADAHYLINKEMDNERTYTKVNELDESTRIHELARMLGGVEVTETTLHHAQEMLYLAKIMKTKM